VTEIERLRNIRQRFLNLLYEVSGGNTIGGIQMQEIGGNVGLDEAETSEIVQWLVDRGLVRWFSMGGNIAITPAGVDNAEAALAEAPPVRTAEDILAAAASPTPEANTSARSADIDVFISHASEDKERFVRPLVTELEARGLRVWFDEAELQVGDSLTRKIDEGLSRSRFGVVVLSKSFFEKDWPRAELDALATRQINSGKVVILPVWLDVAVDEVAQYSPLLASLLALRSGEGTAQIADKIAARVSSDSSAATSAKVETSSPRRLEQAHLLNHIQPWGASPSITSDERALVVRAVLAGSIKTNPEPYLTPKHQEALERAVSESSLERLLAELTENGRAPRSTGLWTHVDPTNTWIISLARPPMPRVMYAGFSVEGRAHVTLRPVPGVGASDWLILGLDVAIRPPVSDESSGGTPLSLDDFHALLYAPITALLEVAPAVLAPLNEGETQILSLGCLLIPNGGGLEDYVRLGIYAADRVRGASDPSAIQWFASSLDDVATTEARLLTTHRLLERFFIDGGYRGYENAIERLTADL
jgi:hypothetical protein